jgi:glucokinase
MTDVLIADVGGTNSRFALVQADGRPQHVLAYANDTTGSMEGAIGKYLADTGAHPVAAVLAVAAPIAGDTIALTNRDWHFQLTELAVRFRMKTVRAINDFEALAWSLLRLGPGDTRPLGPALPAGHGARAVFGPGTGLGVAALVGSEADWRAVPTEGGHVSFGPATDDEEAVFARLRKQHGPISAETILCGPGLERLHVALHPDATALSAEAIDGAAQKDEPAARATVALFVRLLGRFAGDLALTFKATGGIYVAGGVAQRLDRLLDDPAFRAAFEAHPPYQELLAGVPTMLITLDQPGLLGSAVVATKIATEA